MNQKECLFCKIAKGEVPAKKVYEDSLTFAFLDINPASDGHTLVVPKVHSENIFDVSVSDLKNAISIVKKVALSLKENLGYEDVNIIQNTGKNAGQIVSHVHFHVIGRKENDGIFLKFPRTVSDENHLNEIAKKIEISSPPPKEVSAEPGRKADGQAYQYQPKEEKSSGKGKYEDDWDDW